MKMSLLDKFVELAGAATELSKNLPAKPSNGIYSTEFWLTLAGSIFSAASGLIPEPYGGYFSVALIGIYTIGRTVLKIFHALGKANSIPELPAVDPSMLIK
jgi:hypothetical protein